MRGVKKKPVETEPVIPTIPEPEPKPEGWRDAAKQVLIGTCRTCDQMFATTVTWFGDPMTDVYLLPLHLGPDFHSPSLVSITNSKPDYGSLEAQGWQRGHKA